MKSTQNKSILKICKEHGTELNLSNTNISKLEPDILKYLSGRQRIILDNNQIEELPSEIGGMKCLTSLSVNGNSICELPDTICKLDYLMNLEMDNNNLETIPEVILTLKNLTRLRLNKNKIKNLPQDIEKLQDLEDLELNENQLTELPAEIGSLFKLSSLSLKNNNIQSLPPEISQLYSLDYLDVDGNPLISPPPEIVNKGKSAIISYLKEQHSASKRQWLSKLLIVGEGGVGKTSLLRSLKNQSFDPTLTTTHGINIDSIGIIHPTNQEISMILKTWDFGGQEIYHATHQFFLTNRSLFLLVWNARHGYEQGKLFYWLDTINAAAPESPVIIVATHIDERDADLPYYELKIKYPQIVKHCQISNKTLEGVESLKDDISKFAADLPLMGEIWPTNWLNAAEEIRAFKEKYISPQQFWEVFSSNGVFGYNARLLSDWLHELGDILFFVDDDDLDDIVILNPQWVSEYISQILESNDVIKKAGILTREQRDKLWGDLSPAMRNHFLRLMERFDLSYRTMENREISLIVERLPLDPPEYKNKWDRILENISCKEISVKYKLNTVPAGIPTWFIARSHRFTCYTHWRNGALLTDNPQNKNLALIQSFPHDRYVQLTARGPFVQNFFALLMDGLELTIRRFPGLKVERLVPCPGHNGNSCSHEFSYEQLLKRIEHTPPKYFIECPESLEDVDVRKLLFGIVASTMEDVHNEVVQLATLSSQRHKELINEFNETSQKNEDQYVELLSLLQREFAKDFKREQSKIDSHCPNVFVLKPLGEGRIKKHLKGERIQLQLYCQAPGCWHPTQRGGNYIISNPAKWLQIMHPYIKRLISLIKYISPFIGPWIGMTEPEYEKLIKHDIKMMQELVNIIPETNIEDRSNFTTNKNTPEMVFGASLRYLRKFLEERDEGQNWGGLRKIHTPEGHYLWLCEHHAKEYLI